MTEEADATRRKSEFLLDPRQLKLALSRAEKEVTQVAPRLN